MKAGTNVKYGNANLGIFLYPHEKDLKDDTLCSVFNRMDRRITHVPFNGIELDRNSSFDPKEHTYIYELESWYGIYRSELPAEDGDCLVALDNNILVYKGDILDIEFEMYVEEFFRNGIEPILVIDLKRGEVFIYTDYHNVEESREIINRINDNREDDEDYNSLDFI